MGAPALEDAAAGGGAALLILINRGTRARSAPSNRRLRILIQGVGKAARSLRERSGPGDAAPHHPCRSIRARTGCRR